MGASVTLHDDDDEKDMLIGFKDGNCLLLAVGIVAVVIAAAAAAPFPIDQTS